MTEDGDQNYICDCGSHYMGKNCEILKERRVLLKCDFETVCENLRYSYSEFPQQKAFKWIRRNKSTPSGGTGPLKAYEGNYFIYTEASKPAKEGDTATMTSFYKSLQDESCATLSYHMNGKKMGSFSVYAEDKSGNKLATINQEGHQSREWKSMELNIPKGESRLVLRAVRGQDYTGDVAVDNIIWRTGSCFGTNPSPPEEGEGKEEPDN